MRSTFEDRIAEDLTSRGVVFTYEDDRLPYTVQRSYTPDFRLPNGILIEAKGWFTPSDRTKMLLVREAHPEIDIYLLFQSPQNTLSKTSKTTYAAWADKHGFTWSAGTRVPQEWIDARRR